MLLLVSRFLLVLLLVSPSFAVVSQTPGAIVRPLPGEVRGYKVHSARVEPKKTKVSGIGEYGRKSGAANSSDEYDEAEPILIRLGEPRLIRVSPFGVTFDVPVILAPVKQVGEIELLVFEDMTVNGTSVSLGDYEHKFKLPNRDPLVLAPPIRIFVSTPEAVLRTIDEIFDSREVWPVTGRIYVCGRFKKFLVKFKRAVPVDVQTSIKNPLR